jgi:NAD+ synthase (glutamine-hydrolysing)
VRVAAAVPQVRVADCSFNGGRIVDLMRQAEEQHVSLLVFPEQSLPGYTCGDLFQQFSLQQAALIALTEVAKASATNFSGVAVVGLPIALDDQLFNCAAVLHRGRILAVVPKSFIPNYKEFYERRWFSPAAGARSKQVVIHGEAVPFGTNFLFEASDVDGLVIGVEICEDLWVPVPPSSFQALGGATVLVNLSASNDLIGKPAYRQQLVSSQSARCISAYVYACSGPHESTTDVVFGGHCLIAENGVMLAESERLPHKETLLVADVDLERIRADRLRTNSFGDAHEYLETRREFTHIPFRLDRRPFDGTLLREVVAHPFVPAGEHELPDRCEHIFNIQVAGLAKRLEHIGRPSVTIGVSGGLDSTLALLVTCKTFDLLGLPRDGIRAFTMPGFGTTLRTRDNARALMKHLGVSANEVDIRQLCLCEMLAIRHSPFGIDLAGDTVESLTEKLQKVALDQCSDLVFENVQARMRTSVLMNSGFVIGTGDVSEAALGWSTYNGDHMSMYNPNAGIPKTLVKFLVRWAALNEFEADARRTLLDIVATEISPELLPACASGTSSQSTERVIGPYELHDFFLFQFLRYGATPEKILFLAQHAKFDRPYTIDELKHWLEMFIRRFFANQFKRSCMPDGPKVGTISLSPRGDWRMPSDARADEWLRWLD